MPVLHIIPYAYAMEGLYSFRTIVSPSAYQAISSPWRISLGLSQTQTSIKLTDIQRTRTQPNNDTRLEKAHTYFRGRNRTVTVTFSFILCASKGGVAAAVSELKCRCLLRADVDAGELWPSTDVSRTCLEDDVVEEEGELAPFKPLNPNLLDFTPCFDAIATPPQTFTDKHNKQGLTTNSCHLNSALNINSRKFVLLIGVVQRGKKRTIEAKRKNA